MRGLAVLVCSVVLGAAIGLPAGASTRDRSATFGGSPQAESDFDGDGFSDLAIGVPGEAIGDIQGAGIVQVLYGGGGGVSTDDQLWSQDEVGIVDQAETSDAFGSEVAAGDLNGDGYDDLAISAWNETVGVHEEAGAVHVLFGSASGLTAGGNQYLTQNSTIDGVAIKETAGAGDLFGDTLTIGNFGRGAIADLAIGASGEKVGDVPGAGAVHIVYGSAEGVTGTGNQLWHQDTTQGGVLIKGKANENEAFGRSSTAGNLGKSTHEDLVIGTSYDRIAGLDRPGSITVLYGSDEGLKAKGNQLWHEDSPGVNDAAEDQNYFGTSVAAGNFGRSSHADVAIGTPGEDIGGVAGNNAGSIHVLYGSSTGLKSADDQVFHQNSQDGVQEIEDSAEVDDAFGAALVATDFGVTGKADLAISAPLESLGDAELTGVVHVLYGTAEGLAISGNQLWSQETTGIDDAAEDFDQLGKELGAGDFDGDGTSDIAIGVPYEELGDAVSAGVVHVIPGLGGGLAEGTDFLWHQDVPEISGGVEAGDTFGAALVGP